MNEKIIAYYKDQIKFYQKRMKNAEKSLETYKSLGMDVDFQQEVYECEKQIMESFEQKLEGTK